MNLTLLKIGLGAALVLALVIFHTLDKRAALEAAYADGQRDERIVWQQRQAVAETQAEADRKAAQTKIDVADRTYVEATAAAEIQKAELRKALDNEKAAARACAAVTRELRDKLNAVGRHG